ADERPDRAGCIIVLGLAQQQRAAAFEVAQVDVVAERRAADFTAAIYHQHDFRLGVVPARIGAHADLRAPADARQRRRLGEDFRVGTDRDLEILRPEPVLDQRVLEPRRAVASRHDRADRTADALFDAATNLGG